MNPKTDSQKKADNPVHEALAGRKFGLCSGLDKKRGKTGLLDDDLVSSMYGVRSGQIINGKAFLGRTLRQHTGVMSVGHRVARAAGVIVDDNGKLRCPPGTPNANQFTDLNMSGCMDYTPTGSAEDQAKEALNRLMAATRDAGMQARQQKVKEAFGDISTVQKQKAALAKAYPNANLDLDERFLDRISPFGRRNVQAARESFVAGLLAESLDFPEVAERITSIRDDLVGSEDGHTRANALLRFDPDGVSMEISMSQLAAARPSESNGFTSTNFDAGRTDADWHHAAVHEFGHMVDAVNLMSEMGLDDSDGTIKKVRPHTNNSDFDQKYEQIISAMSDARIAGDGDELVKQQDELSKLLLSELTDGVDTNFGRYVDKSEHDEILDLVPGEYARSHYEGTKSLGEAKAELYAFARINGHTPEMPDGESGMIAKNSRDRLQELLGVDVPGPNDKRSGVADAASWRRPAGSKPTKRAARRAAKKPKRRREAPALVQNQRSAEEMSAVTRAKNERVLSLLEESGGVFRLTPETELLRREMVENLPSYRGYKRGDTTEEHIAARLPFYRKEVAERLAQWRKNYRDEDSGEFYGYDPQTAPHIGDWGKNLERIQEYLDSTSDDELVAGILDVVRRNIEDEDTRVAVQMPLGRWAAFMADGGVYRTTHEVQSDHSGVDARNPYEVSIGIPSDAPAEVRPASGYIQYGRRRRAGRAFVEAKNESENVDMDKDFLAITQGGAAMYGPISFVMRKEVNERTRFTQGDSFNVTGDPAPVTGATDEELLNMVFRSNGGKGGARAKLEQIDELVNILAGGDETQLGGITPLERDKFDSGQLTSGVKTQIYHEAMIMGSFDLNDVESIQIDSGQAALLIRDLLPEDNDPVVVLEWLAKQDYDPRYAEIIQRIDSQGIIKQYQETNPKALEKLMRETNVTLSNRRIMQELEQVAFLREIRKVNDEVMVDFFNYKGEDQKAAVAKIAAEKGLAPEDLFPTLLEERLGNLVARLDSGEIPRYPEPEPVREYEDSII